MKFFAVLAVLSLIFAAVFGEDCSTFTTSSKCLKNSANGVKCAWCDSSAVKSSCYGKYFSYDYICSWFLFFSFFLS